MRLKITILGFVTVASLNATTMTKLFNSLEKQPSTQIDELNKRMGQMGVEKVNANYYPTIDIFGSFTHYSDPTALMPLDPIATGKLTKAGKPLPFANTIEKVGVLVNMPLFAKEIGELSDKMKHLARSAKYKKQLNLYKAQATIVGANSGLEYMDNLLKALRSTKRSVLNTKKDIKISVKSGRMPSIALDKIEQKVNELDIKINTIKIQRLNLISQIQKLTNVALHRSVHMHLKGHLAKGSIFALKPLEELVKASSKDVSAAQAKRYYPKVGLNMMYSKSYAQKDVFKGQDVDEGYGYVQVAASIPLFNRGKDVDIELKKIQYLKDIKKFKKTKLELKTDIKMIQSQLTLLQKSSTLTRKNIEKQKKLLKFAKKAVKEGRMTQEDYLKYEDGVLTARAAYYQVVSQKWQNIAKLGVIYGNNLKRIIK